MLYRGEICGNEIRIGRFWAGYTSILSVISVIEDSTLNSNCFFENEKAVILRAEDKKLKFKLC